MKQTLLSFFHDFNLQKGGDVDIYVDGEDSIALVTPVTLTPAGKEHFKQALEATIDTDFMIVGEDDSEETCSLVWELLAALAGYCSVREFAEWFGDDDVKYTV